ncbi:Thermoresistant gluconokinase [Pluralibacter gergoviae]|nr:Thermoresistant gluconokinase [Pluralibacter gergoviae]
MSTTNHEHHVYVLMGVSGSGKSAVASEVAHRLNAAFLDGDFLHPRSNIEKMSSGAPLNDDDRKPWLQALKRCRFCDAADQQSVADRLFRAEKNLSRYSARR